MDTVLSAFKFIQGLGPSVMMPIIIFILGVILKAGIGKSIRAGLTVGIGFIGLNLVIGLMSSSLGPAVQQMVERYGLSLSVIDVGWPAAAAIAFASTLGTIIIPLCLLINIIMLFTNTTQTVDVDIWDYWHFAFTGALVAIITDSQIFGIIAAILNMIIIMVIADYTAPALEKTKNIRKVLEAISSFGMNIRGMYGENNQVQGDIYQISNKQTLGITEQEIVQNVKVMKYILRKLTGL